MYFVPYVYEEYPKHVQTPDGKIVEVSSLEEELEVTETAEKRGRGRPRLAE